MARHVRLDEQRMPKPAKKAPGKNLADLTREELLATWDLAAGADQMVVLDSYPSDDGAGFTLRATPVVSARQSHGRAIRPSAPEGHTHQFSVDIESAPLSFGRFRAGGRYVFDGETFRVGEPGEITVSQSEEEIRANRLPETVTMDTFMRHMPDGTRLETETRTVRSGDGLGGPIVSVATRSRVIFEDGRACDWTPFRQ